MFLAERRKTWSGTTHKVQVEQDQHAETDDEHHGDANNNSYTTHDDKDMYYTDKSSYGTEPYNSDVYTSRAQYDNNTGYDNITGYDNNTGYYSPNSTSYNHMPNFKI